jgi:tetratricopeptide (TPR) repeat protein
MAYHYTAPSGSGLRLPTSGKIVGLVTDALRLRVACRRRWRQSGKTLQRYFAGNRVTQIDPDEVLRTLVAALLPDQAPPAVSFASMDLHHAAFTLAKRYRENWDAFTAKLHADHFPVTELRDVPIPPLRFVVLELGLRWGAWETLRTLDAGANPNWSPRVLAPEGVRIILDELRGDRTIEQFAASLDITPEAVRAWRTGHSCPSDQVIDLLETDPDARWRVFELRWAVAIHSARADLGKLIGEDVVEDMIAASAETARRVHASHSAIFELRSRPEMWSPLAPINAAASVRKAREMMRQVLFEGARSEPGEHICAWLSRQVARQDLAADFAALSLPTDWAERASYWTWRLGSLRQEVAFSLGAASGGEATKADHVRFTDGLRSMLLRMAEFDAPSPVDVLSSIPVAGPFGEAMQLANVAERLCSVGRLHDAVDALRDAVRLAPNIAVLHFKLGATLGILAFHGHSEQFDEALRECHLAVGLAPTEGNFRNEIGIILSNRRDHEAAEVAFAEAEPHFGDHHLHWYARGNNFVGLERFDDARDAFARGVELSEPVPDIHCLRGLAACLMAIAETMEVKAEAGRLRREARRVADRAMHLSGTDPILDWRDTLDIWRDNARR